MTLDIFTFITGRGAEYAEYLKYTCEKNLTGNHKINWKCVESLNTQRLPDGFKCVCKAGGEYEHNSMKHAIAIKKALKYIESDYVLLVDSDVAVVYKGWDDVIIKKLTDYDCFGGAYARGRDKRIKTRYRNFPKANFFAFRADVLKKVNLDFRPFRGANFRGKVTKKYSKLFDMPVGADISYDVGWRLPVIFKTNKLAHDYMMCYLMGSKKIKLPYLNEKHKKFCNKKNITMEEWHYNGELFAAHQKHARHYNLNDGLGLAWKQRVDLYLGGIR